MAKTITSPTALSAPTYQWTASGSNSEYYLELSGGGDPSITEPDAVYEGSTTLAVGTVGSLAVDEWDWGDNDTLGYSTVYVKLTSGDPADLGYDGITGDISATLAKYKATIDGVGYEEDRTLTTLVATTVTKIYDEADLANVEILGIHPEALTDLKYAFQPTGTPAPVTNDMKTLPSPLYFGGPKDDPIPKGDMYLVSATGGAVVTFVGV